MTGRDWNSDRANGVTFRQVAQRIRVSAGFVLAPLLLIAARPTPESLAGGAVLAAAGLVVRAWASGHLKKNQELTTSGPYAYTRNPLYLGTFILGTGVAVCSGAPWFVALFMTVYVLIYFPVMSAEAETMRELFPDEYEQYRKHVPLFLPRLAPYRGPYWGERIGACQPEEERPGVRRFEAALYLRHREYRAALGFIAILALLTAKFYLNSVR